MRFTDEKLRLVCPTPEYEARAREFIEEFARFSSELNGTGGLAPFLEKNDYEGWLRKLAADLDLANIPEGRVPAITYFYVRERDGRVVGMVNIRLEDNWFIRNEAGHVGYCIRPTERRKHYASQLLADALEVCRRMRIERVVVTCDRENVASAKTIESCGGVPEAELWSETFRETIRRYVILPPLPAAEEQDSGENAPEDDPHIRAAVDYIAELFRGDSGGHDAEHSLRVFRSARRIAAGEGNCDPTVVALAALLHDADDPTITSCFTRSKTPTPAPSWSGRGCRRRPSGVSARRSTPFPSAKTGAGVRRRRRDGRCRTPTGWTPWGPSASHVPSPTAGPGGGV